MKSALTLPRKYARSLGRILRPQNRLEGHYVFDLDDGPIGYCYIRKNACSVFKRLIAGTSPHRPQGRITLQFLNRCHRLDYDQVPACRHVVFVIRDPLERIVSGYLNQVVMRLHQPYPVLAESIQAVTGRSRGELSFKDFIDRYLETRDFSRINVHYLPQVAHLAPLRYTVLEDKTLASDAAQVFGPAIAAEYFARPINASSAIAVRHEPEAWSLPAAELRRRLDETASMPRKADLLTPETIAQLGAIYRDDVALFARYRALRAADPAKVPTLDLRDPDFSVHFGGKIPRPRAPQEERLS